MEATSYVALSRQTGLRRQLNIVANNLANMNTSGFKGEKMMFVEHLTKSKGGHKPIAEKVAYVRDIATVRDFSEGPLEKTGNPLDMAIAGEGFFIIQTDQGNQYTRNGRFQLDQGGQLVNQQGHPVLAEGGNPIFFAPGDTNIRTSRLQNDAVSNIDDLIGKSPRRGIREGQTFRSSAVQDPVLVEKGSLVTIVLQAPQMFLTAQGKAMQAGSDGDVIRISNTQSNKQIEAEVIGAGRVAVRQSTLLALTN